MLHTEPEPVILTDDHANLDQYNAYRDALHDYMFQSRWLQVALSPQEYNAVMDLPGTLLQELYVDVYEEGPMGAVWRMQLRHMLRIFNMQDPIIDPAKFMDDFIDTYGRHGIRGLFNTPGLWKYVQQIVEADDNISALMPDVDAYLGTLPHQVRTTTYMAQLRQTEAGDARYFQFSDALEEHAKTVLLSYVLRDLSVAQPFMAHHDAF